MCAARSCLFNHLLSFSGAVSRFSKAIHPLNVHSGSVLEPAAARFCRQSGQLPDLLIQISEHPFVALISMDLEAAPENWPRVMSVGRSRV